MKTVDARPGQFKKGVEQLPEDEPVVMLNLLRFRESAQYPKEHANTNEPLSGKKAYALYSKAATPHLQKAGAKVLWMGKGMASMIGPEGERWDEVLLVKYPSIKHFMAMVMSEEYQQLSVHRTAALEDSRLVATTEMELWN